MKRLLQNVLFVLVVALGFMLVSTNVYAEEVGSDVSKWTVPPIEKLTTSDGVDIVPDTSNIVIDVGPYWAEVSGEVILNITIKEDYEKDEIVIAPEVFQTISREIYSVFKKAGMEQGLDEDYFKFNNPFQAGDSFRVRLVITNLSKFNYYYEETSFEIFPTEPLVYGKSTGETTGDKFFNGIELPEGFTFRRTYNTALQDLISNSSGRNMTDDVVGAALTEKGYNGIADYAKYLLDFYNEKYGTSYTRLDQFNKGIIREMFNDVDPLYGPWVARKLGVFVTPALQGNPEKLKAEILDKLAEKNYDNALDFVLEYFGISNISELTDDMIYEFFGEAGGESGSFATETNKTMLILAYNYFYNEGLGFYFDTKDENGNYGENPEISNSNYNGGSYSIGSYLRDETKGDEEIKERAGTLESNSENTISGTLKNVGNYTPNAYLDYFFMVNLQLRYKAKYGNLIIKYVDREGNELLSDVTSREMVGRDYQTNAEDIKNYELVEIQGDETGKYIDGTIVVVYVYDKVGGEETGEITPPNTGVSVGNDNLLLLLSLVTVGTVGFSLAKKN